MQMSKNVKAKRASVASNVGNTTADSDIRWEVVDVSRVVVRQPVLGRGMAVAKDDGRETRNRVSFVCDAELLAGLAACKVGKLVIADSWGAVSVEVAGVASSSEIGGTKVGDSTAERVAGKDDPV